MNAIWVTRDGRHIPIDQMEEEHIDSAIRVLEGQMAAANEAMNARPAFTYEEDDSDWTSQDQILLDACIGIAKRKRILIAEKARRKMALTNGIQPH